jgi:hypothetical protein
MQLLGISYARLMECVLFLPFLALGNMPPTRPAKPSQIDAPGVLLARRRSRPECGWRCRLTHGRVSPHGARKGLG